MDYIKKENIIKEFEIGKTKIKICDEFCKDKDRNNVNEILNNISSLIVENIKSKL